MSRKDEDGLPQSTIINPESSMKVQNTGEIVSPRLNASKKAAKKKKMMNQLEKLQRKGKKLKPE